MNSNLAVVFKWVIATELSTFEPFFEGYKQPDNHNWMFSIASATIFLGTQTDDKNIQRWFLDFLAPKGTFKSR